MTTKIRPSFKIITRRNHVRVPDFVLHLKPAQVPELSGLWVRGEKGGGGGAQFDQQRGREERVPLGGQAWDQNWREELSLRREPRKWQVSSTNFQQKIKILIPDTFWRPHTASNLEMKVSMWLSSWVKLKLYRNFFPLSFLCVFIFTLQESTQCPAGTGRRWRCPSPGTTYTRSTTRSTGSTTSPSSLWWNQSISRTISTSGETYMVWRTSDYWPCSDLSVCPARLTWTIPTTLLSSLTAGAKVSRYSILSGRSPLSPLSFWRNEDNVPFWSSRS